MNTQLVTRLCVPITDGFETINYDCKDFTEEEVITESLGFENISKALELTEELRADHLFSKQLKRLVDADFTLYPATLHALRGRVKNFRNGKIDYTYLESIVTELIERSTLETDTQYLEEMSVILSFTPVN